MGKILAWFYSWRKVPLTFDKNRKVIPAILFIGCIIFLIFAVWSGIIGNDFACILDTLIAAILLLYMIIMATNNLADQVKELKKQIELKDGSK